MSGDIAFDHSLLHTSTASERRAAALRAEQERAELRRIELSTQAAPGNDPQERIRIWERLHALQIPATPGHPLVAVIAAQTHLSVRDIENEQQRRRQLREPAGQIL